MSALQKYVDEHQEYCLTQRTHPRPCSCGRDQAAADLADKNLVIEQLQQALHVRDTQLADLRGENERLQGIIKRIDELTQELVPYAVSNYKIREICSAALEPVQP